MWLKKGWQESQLRAVRKRTRERSGMDGKDRQRAGTMGGGMGDGSGQCYCDLLYPVKLWAPWPRETNRKVSSIE